MSSRNLAAIVGTTVLVLVLALAGAVATRADDTPPAVSTTNAQGPAVAVAAAAPAGGERRFMAYTTGYGWPDNTPPGSADICCGVVHSRAGGTGTYADPVTLAVGHVISGGRDRLDYPAGTRFYIPNLRKYFIVEDSCGDGPAPQNRPCHIGYRGYVWLDQWVGGSAATRRAALQCESAITDVHLVIENPASTYAVEPGEVLNGCRQFGDAF